MIPKSIYDTHEVLLKSLAPKDKIYPVYEVSAWWTQATPAGSEDRIHRVGQPVLPPGRTYNSTAWTTMLERPETLEVLEERYRTVWWPARQKNFPESSEPDILVTFRRWDTWCEAWFSHWTFDSGMTDQEVLASFRAYVERVERIQEQERWDGIECHSRCLMGAEDRYRWKSSPDSGEESLPPCRCADCKKHGIVRIDH